MNKKLKVTVNVLDNVVYKYTDTKIHIENNLKEKKM